MVGASTTFTAIPTPQNGAPTPTNYAWTFGDASAPINTGTPSSSHTYSAAGTFSASVTVTGGSASGTRSTNVTVVAPDLIITVTCPAGVHVATVIQCNVSATLRGAPVPSAQIATVSWNFGDSTGLLSQPGSVSPPHIYGTAGAYTVQATATVTGASATGAGSITTTILP
jgi:PKD repeat protein